MVECIRCDGTGVESLYIAYNLPRENNVCVYCKGTGKITLYKKKKILNEIKKYNKSLEYSNKQNYKMQEKYNRYIEKWKELSFWRKFFIQKESFLIFKSKERQKLFHQGG